MGYNLTQINPAYELVGDVVVGTATTSVDFTGLNITKEDDYMLVSDIVNNYSGNIWLRLMPNGNYTTSNYYYQILNPNGTGVGAGRGNDNILSQTSNGLKSFVITNIKLTNNGYFTYQSNGARHYGGSFTAIEKDYNTSTFTLTSITSLRLASTQANAIGIGSRFQLYKRKAPIISDIIVSTATTSVDIAGLSIDKGSEYMLVSDVVNASGSTSVYKLNGNSLVDTNFYAQRLSAFNESVDGARVNLPNIDAISTGNKLFCISNIKLTNNGFITFQHNAIMNYGGSSIGITNSYVSSTTTSVSITQLTITSTIANGIGAGSRFQLIKLK